MHRAAQLNLILYHDGWCVVGLCVMVPHLLGGPPLLGALCAAPTKRLCLCKAY